MPPAVFPPGPSPSFSVPSIFPGFRPPSLTRDALRLGLALLFTAACGPEEGGTGPSVAVRDSAGIRIVESSGPRWEEGDEWRLDTASVAVMGRDDGEAGLVWRVMGVTRLSDGRVAVLNSGSGEIRYFGANGRILKKAGGMGEGPGEFAYPMAFTRSPGDTLVVLDRDGTRAWFDPQGEFVREAAFSRAPPNPDRPVFFTFDAPLPDGSILGRDRPQEEPRPQGSGWFRPTIHVRRKDGASVTLADFGTYGEIQQEMLDVGRGAWPIVPPFARVTNVALGGNEPRVVVGDNDEFELRVFDLDGTLLHLVRLLAEPEPVTAGEVEAWKERQRTASWVEGQLPQLERGWAQMRVPETKPAFGSQFGLTTHGYLWVAEYTAAPSKPHTLHIFDSRGAYLGPMTIPDGLAFSPRIVEIGPDYFLGVFMDEMDVETVRLYPLRGGGG